MGILGQHSEGTKSVWLDSRTGTERKRASSGLAFGWQGWMGFGGASVSIAMQTASDRGCFVALRLWSAFSDGSEYYRHTSRRAGGQPEEQSVRRTWKRLVCWAVAVVAAATPESWELRRGKDIHPTSGCCVGASEQPLGSRIKH